MSDSSCFETRFSEVIAHLKSNNLPAKVDILVNNAGINMGGFWGNVDGDIIDKVLATNVKGVFFLSQLVAKHMRDNQIQGNILNLASSSSLRPAAWPYSISKWGIRGLHLAWLKL